MTNIELQLATALALLAAMTAGQTLSSDPEWMYSSTKASNVDINFKSDTFKLD